jgi:hypothetical protein
MKTDITHFNSGAFRAVVGNTRVLVVRSCSGLRRSDDPIDDGAAVEALVVRLPSHMRSVNRSCLPFNCLAPRVSIWDVRVGIGVSYAPGWTL